MPNNLDEDVKSDTLEVLDSLTGGEIVRSDLEDQNIRDFAENLEDLRELGREGKLPDWIEGIVSSIDQVADQFVDDRTHPINDPEVFKSVTGGYTLGATPESDHNSSEEISPAVAMAYHVLTDPEALVEDEFEDVEREEVLFNQLFHEVEKFLSEEGEYSLERKRDLVTGEKEYRDQSQWDQKGAMKKRGERITDHIRQTHSPFNYGDFNISASSMKMSLNFQDAVVSFDTKQLGKFTEAVQLLTQGHGIEEVREQMDYKSIPRAVQSISPLLEDGKLPEQYHESLQQFTEDFSESYTESMQERMKELDQSINKEFDTKMDMVRYVSQEYSFGYHEDSLAGLFPTNDELESVN